MHLCFFTDLKHNVVLRGTQIHNKNLRIQELLKELDTLQMDVLQMSRSHQQEQEELQESTDVLNLITEKLGTCEKAICDFACPLWHSCVVCKCIIWCVMWCVVWCLMCHMTWLCLDSIIKYKIDLFWNAIKATSFNCANNYISEQTSIKFIIIDILRNIHCVNN